MLPNNHTIVNPTNFTIKIALGKPTGSEYVQPFIAASGGVRAFLPPAPDPLNPGQINQRDVTDIGGNLFEGPDYWMQMTDNFCVWALGILFNAMHIQTNIAVCDGAIAPIGAQSPQAWSAATLARQAVLDGPAPWQVYVRMPNEVNDFTDDCIAGVDLNTPGSYFTCDFSARDSGAGFCATGHEAGAARLLVAINALARLARCCPVGTAGMDALSVSFAPQLGHDAQSGHVYHWSPLLTCVKGEYAGVVEYVDPQALFIRVVSAIIGRFAFPSTERSMPFTMKLDLAQDGSALDGVEVAVANWLPDGTLPYPADPAAEWVAGTVAESCDNSYLSRFKSNGLFMPSLLAPMTAQTLSYKCFNLWPVPLAADVSDDNTPFHKWYHPNGTGGPGWTAVLNCIENSPITALLPSVVDFDYVRFHTSVPTPTVDFDPVLAAISQGVSDVSSVIHQQTTSVNAHVDDRLSSTQAAIDDHLSSAAGGINATTGSAAASVHTDLANRAGEILTAIANIPEGERTMDTLREAISRQQADVGVVAAVCLAILRKQLSPKRFHQVIEQLSNLEYKPVRALRPGEDVTAGETGPLSPYFELFDKFGRPRPEREQ